MVTEFFSNRHRLLLAAVTIAASTAMASIATADVINVQYPTHNNNSSSVPYVVYTGTGAAPDTGTFWNQADDTNGTGTLIADLKDSQGNATTVSLSELSSAVNGQRGQASPAVPNALLDSYLFLAGATSTTPATTDGFTISGLTPGAQYDLYLYASDGGLANGQGAAFTVNGVSFGQTGSKTTTSSATSTTIPTSDLGISYVEGTTTADASGDIAVSFTYNTVSPTNGGIFNGFQLVGPSTVPEPTDIALFGVGALGLLLLRRRRSA